MDLFCISLTGADDAVSVEDLARLSAQFPQIEWAILSSEQRAGTSRYPTEEWVERFHLACPDVRKAIHLCGRDVDLFMNEDARIHAKVAKFDRVQLNFNHRRKPLDVEKLIQLSKKLPTTIILQHNSANAPLWDLVQGKMDNVAFLFDGSGGNGKLPEQWPDILPDTVCGFAGGLSPTNISQQLPRILLASKGNRCWVDMESGLRHPETDAFSLAFCESVMEQTMPFL